MFWPTNPFPDIALECSAFVDNNEPKVNQLLFRERSVRKFAYLGQIFNFVKNLVDRIGHIVLLVFNLILSFEKKFRFDLGVNLEQV